MLYIALIGDLIESKQLKNRKQAQKDLQDMMAVLNQDYHDYLVSPFTVRLEMSFRLCCGLIQRLCSSLIRLPWAFLIRFALDLAWGRL